MSETQNNSDTTAGARKAPDDTTHIPHVSIVDTRVDVDDIVQKTAESVAEAERNMLHASMINKSSGLYARLSHLILEKEDGTEKQLSVNVLTLTSSDPDVNAMIAEVLKTHGYSCDVYDLRMKGVQ